MVQELSDIHRTELKEKLPAEVLYREPLILSEESEFVKCSILTLYKGIPPFKFIPCENGPFRFKMKEGGVHKGFVFEPASDEKTRHELKGWYSLVQGDSISLSLHYHFNFLH